VYDSQGGAHQVTLYYSKTRQHLDVHDVYADPANPDSSRARESADADLDTAGTLTSVSAGSPVFDFGGGVTPAQSISFDHTERCNMLELRGSEARPDGYSRALRNLIISDAGVMTATSRTADAVIGQVAMAKFIAPTELVKLGETSTGVVRLRAADREHPGTSGLGASPRTRSNSATSIWPRNSSR